MNLDGYKIEVDLINRFERAIIKKASVNCIGKRFHGYSKDLLEKGYTILYFEPRYAIQVALESYLSELSEDFSVSIKVIDPPYNDWQDDFIKEKLGPRNIRKYKPNFQMVEIYIPVDREEQNLLLGLLRLKGL